jgi:hypothetical protein
MIANSQCGDKDEFVVLTQSLRKLSTIQQGQKESTAKYHERFRIAGEVLVGHWGEFYPPALVKNGLTRQETQDRFLARIFLMGADKSRFGQLIEDLSNDYASGIDRYPKTLESTLKLLSTYGINQKSHKTFDDNETRYLKSFAQQGKQVSPSKKQSRDRNRPSASATDGSDSDSSAGQGVPSQGARNRRSRSPSRAGREGWSST